MPDVEFSRDPWGILRDLWGILWIFLRIYGPWTVVDIQFGIHEGYWGVLRDSKGSQRENEGFWGILKGFLEGYWGVLRDFRGKLGDLWGILWIFLRIYGTWTVVDIQLGILEGLWGISKRKWAILQGFADISKHFWVLLGRWTVWHIQTFKRSSRDPCGILNFTFKGSSRFTKVLKVKLKILEPVLGNPGRWAPQNE